MLRDKFPFQPPIVMSKTNFSTPSLADGRDLLNNLLPDGQTEWRPSMNLQELILQLPGFIESTIKEKNVNTVRQLGRFHLGLNYDMLIWLANTQCRVFPCQ